MAARVLKGEKLEQEMARLKAMAEYEKEYNARAHICNIGKAGREPLARPVTAGAVMLPKGCRILYLNDSKKLSEKHCEELFLEMKEGAVAWNVDLTSPARINEINILQATYGAVREVVEGLSVKPEALLDDAIIVSGLEGVRVPVIKGDTKSLSIATANILTKAVKGHMTAEYEELFPGYGFARHKGYGTATRAAAIGELGPYLIHRRNFIRNIVQADTYE